MTSKKVSVKQTLEDLRSTVSYLNKQRDIVIHAATIQKGELDRYRDLLAIRNKEYAALRKECDNFEMDLDFRQVDLKKAQEEISRLTSSLENQQGICSRYYKDTTKWINEYRSKKEVLFWTRVVLFIFIVPYISYGINWIIHHVGFCLH